MPNHDTLAERDRIAQIINSHDTNRAALVRDVSAPAMWHEWAANEILGIDFTWNGELVRRAADQENTDA